MKTDKKIGLALSGGATKALATFAIIEEMDKLNIPFSYMAGTSAGAIIAAHYALFGEVKTLRKELLSFSKKEWLSFADFTMTNTKSLIKAKKYREYLKSKFQDADFKDTKIPLIIPATNIKKGKVDYLCKGKILDALLASSAYPGVFPPHKIGENLYVDGGVLDNLPYEILFQKRMDKVIAVNLKSDQSAGKDSCKNLFNVINRSIDLMIDNAFKNIYSENDALFVFQVIFKKGINSSWNISNLDKKYKSGKNEFSKNKTEFLAWLDS